MDKVSMKSLGFDIGNGYPLRSGSEIDSWDIFDS
jgi:hypothetical protein